MRFHWAVLCLTAAAAALPAAIVPSKIGIWRPSSNLWAWDSNKDLN
jgi:hypothetical protein